MLVERMCAAIEHRGPDSRGTLVDGGVGLGIQRLRIIDLETGDQPIFNEDRSVVVVLNGEIYNYQELRARLIRAGHRFSTHSDTEVIVHLYEEEGVDCVNSLNGMFAFALWDARRRQLLLARDRVGKKPLFYAHRSNALTFGSELRAVLEDNEVSRDLDHQALDCYYAYQYVPAPWSAFRAIRKLPPAMRMIWRAGRITQERYWRLRYTPKRSVPSIDDLHEEIRTTIDAAVRRRMIADVPLGAFLSGGIDSSAVVAAMARHSSGKVKTFSIGFDDEAFNELPQARAIAERFSTEHHEYIVEPNAIELLPRIVRHYGEPFADASAIPSFYLSELTRRHVTVALNGDGGDESFGGYNRYVRNAMPGRLDPGRFDRLPSALRRAAGTLAARLPPGSRTQSSLSRARRFGRSLALTPGERYAMRMSHFNRYERAELYTDEYRGEIGLSKAPQIIADPWAHASGNTIIDVMLETDVETYLPGDLLVKMDISTMAHSLEARSPFLDPAIMELAASIPAHFKVSGDQKKIVLRDALSSWLPRELLDRPKKGFGVPIGRWFRSQLRGYVEDVLLDERTLRRGYFRRAYVEQMLTRHVNGHEDNSPRIWSLLVSELWHRDFVDEPISTPHPAVVSTHDRRG